MRRLLCRAGEFFDTNQFRGPKDVDDIQSRLKTNLSYFYGNYLLIIVFFLLVVGYIYPYFLFTNLFFLAAAIFIFQYRGGQVVRIGDGVTLTKAQQAYMWSALYMLFFIWTAGYASVYGISAGVLLAIAHAVVRKATLRESATVKIDQMADKAEKFAKKAL
jgi:hypothetical protein